MCRENSALFAVHVIIYAKQTSEIEILMYSCWKHKPMSLDTWRSLMCVIVQSLSNHIHAVQTSSKA